MSTVVDKQITEAEKAVTALLRDVDQEVFARVQAWIGKMAGGAKLSDFLYDETSPVVERVTIVRSLIDILEAKDYDRLPMVEAKPKAKPRIRGFEPTVVIVDEMPFADIPPPVFSKDDVRNGDGSPPPDELRTLVQHEVRLQLASILETIAKVLRDTK